MGADSHELLDARHPFNDDVVFDDNVAGHIHGVGQNHVVTNLDIVGHMDIRHDEAVVPDPGHLAVRGCSWWMVTHSRTLVRSSISTVVGSPLYFRSCESAPTTQPGKSFQVILTHFGVPNDGGVGAYPCSSTDVHVGADKCERLHGCVCADVRRGIDVGEWGNLG